MNEKLATRVANFQTAIDELKAIIHTCETSIHSFSADNQKLICEKITEAKGKVAEHERYIAKLVHISETMERFENSIPETPTLTLSDGTVVVAQGRTIVSLTDTLRPIILARVNNVAVVYISTAERDVVVGEVYVGKHMTDEGCTQIAELIGRYTVER